MDILRCTYNIMKAGIVYHKCHQFINNIYVVEEGFLKGTIYTGKGPCTVAIQSHLSFGQWAEVPCSEY